MIGGIMVNAKPGTMNATIKGALDASPGVSTKFRIEPEAGDIAGQVEQAFAKSLARLGVERFELLQLTTTFWRNPPTRASRRSRFWGPAAWSKACSA